MHCLAKSLILLQVSSIYKSASILLCHSPSKASLNLLTAFKLIFKFLISSRLDLSL